MPTAKVSGLPMVRLSGFVASYAKTLLASAAGIWDASDTQTASTIPNNEKVALTIRGLGPSFRERLRLTAITNAFDVSTLILPFSRVMERFVDKCGSRMLVLEGTTCSEAIGLQEVANNLRELLWFFKIHEVTRIGNHNPA